jgi:transcriptional regulator with XRE-family HTH domain
LSILSERLTEQRKKHGFTRKHICKQLKIGVKADDPVPILANYERGDRTPSIELIIEFARYYKVSTDYLLGISDYENPGYESVTEKLGLSGNAIQALERINLQSKTVMEIVNLLLISDESNHFYSHLCFYCIPDSYKFDFAPVKRMPIGVDYKAIIEIMHDRSSDTISLDKIKDDLLELKTLSQKLDWQAMTFSTTAEPKAESKKLEITGGGDNGERQED